MHTDESTSPISIWVCCLFFPPSFLRITHMRRTLHSSGSLSNGFSSPSPDRDPSHGGSSEDILPFSGSLTTVIASCRRRLGGRAMAENRSTIKVDLPNQQRTVVSLAIQTVLKIKGSPAACRWDAWYPVRQGYRSSHFPDLLDYNFHDPWPGWLGRMESKDNWSLRFSISAWKWWAGVPFPPIESGLCFSPVKSPLFFLFVYLFLRKGKNMEVENERMSDRKGGEGKSQKRKSERDKGGHLW